MNSDRFQPPSHRSPVVSRRLTGTLLALAALGPWSLSAWGQNQDLVLLKDGRVLQGVVERDNVFFIVADSMRRITLRRNWVASTDPAPNPPTPADIRLFHANMVQGGDMPEFALNFKVGQWNAELRREVSYVGTRDGRATEFIQAVHLLGPKVCEIRGLNRFWKANHATSEIPKELILGMFRRIKADNLDNPEALKKLTIFLIQADWLEEALIELDELARRFPGEAEAVERTRSSVLNLIARRELEGAQAALKRGRPREARRRLEILVRRFPLEGETARRVEAQRLEWETRDRFDRELAERLVLAADALPPNDRAAWSPALIEMLQALAEVPDIVGPLIEIALDETAAPHSRVAAGLNAANANANGNANAPAEVTLPGSPIDVPPPPSVTNPPALGNDPPTAPATADPAQAPSPAPDNASPASSRFARAASIFVAGPEQMTGDLDAAALLWNARALLRVILADDNDPPPDLIAQLDALGVDAPLALTLIQRMPPVRADRSAASGMVRTWRTRDSESPDSVEYVVQLPEEYHPLRSYPAVIALHDGDGPEQARALWGPEAARRGFILIAPEYRLPNRPADYGFTREEHAAVELALRDASKRLAIDTDRVGLVGSLFGGTMAWDVGLSHPGRFNGVVAMSALPGKHIAAYKPNAKLASLYIIQGKLTPGCDRIIAEGCRALIGSNNDLTYVEYYHRGLETIAGEVPAAYDWLEARKRNTYPSEFKVVAGREGDTRFYGTVINAFAPGRAPDPAGIDATGSNLKPATLSWSLNPRTNSIKLETDGVTSLDVWLPPVGLDPQRPVELRVNGKTWFKGLIPRDLEPMLRDLRIRGDRRQTYLFRVQAG